MEKRFEYRGDLAVTPLAEILGTIHRYGVPGVLRALKDGRERRLYIEQGLLVFAMTNEREMSLGVRLLKKGLITPESGREAARRVREGLRLGQVLLEMGALTENHLKEEVGAQIREILWGAFEWETGEVAFEIGERRSEEPIRIDLSIPEAILEGIRRTKDVRRLVHRLGQASTVLEKASGAMLPLFSTDERLFYEKVDGKAPLQSLCEKGPGSLAENARVLYAFFCLGMLRKTPVATPAVKKIRYSTGGGSLAE